MAGGGTAMDEPEIDLVAGAEPWEEWLGEVRGGEPSSAFFLCRASFSLKVSLSGLKEAEEGGETDPSGMGATTCEIQHET